MSALVSAGRFWCPGCCCMRLFVVAEDAAPSEAAPDLECETCFYVVRKARQELPPVVPGGPGRVVTVQLLPESVRTRAREKWLAEVKAHAVASGYRLENWTHARPT